MTIYKTVQVPNSPLVIDFSDDCDSDSKVFVSKATGHHFDCFCLEDVLVVGEGMMIGDNRSFHVITKEEMEFISGLIPEASRFTWAMNVAQGKGDQSQCDVATEFLEDYGYSPSRTFGR
jgi:hypothetical protein